jgi:Tfp pilus assembly ATPase PilU
MDASTTAAAPAPGPDAAGNGMRALLRAMVQMKASDLHVSAATAPTVRLDGEITPLPGCRPLSAQELLAGTTPISPTKFPG